MFRSKTTERNSGKGFTALHFSDQLIAAAVRQSDVANEKIELLRAHFFHGLLRGMGHCNLVTAALQHPLHAGAGISMIVHHQDTPVSGRAGSFLQNGTSIFSGAIAVGADRTRHRRQFQRKSGTLIPSGALHPDLAAVRID
jgi:hypothetical protein